MKFGIEGYINIRWSNVIWVRIGSVWTLLYMKLKSNFIL